MMRIPKEKRLRAPSLVRPQYIHAGNDMMFNVKWTYNLPIFSYKHPSGPVWAWAWGSGLSADRCWSLNHRNPPELKPRASEGLEMAVPWQWGCMLWEVGDADKIDGRMDGDLYIKILENELQSSLAFYDKITQGILFQQQWPQTYLQEGSKLFPRPWFQRPLMACTIGRTKYHWIALESPEEVGRVWNTPCEFKNLCLEELKL